jgi:hypothetical protein
MGILYNGDFKPASHRAGKTVKKEDGINYPVQCLSQ